jgi:hypothetical protein
MSGSRVEWVHMREEHYAKLIISLRPLSISCSRFLDSVPIFSLTLRLSTDLICNQVNIGTSINTKISRQQANGRIYFSEEKYMKRSRAAMKSKNQIQAYERKAKGKSYEAHKYKNK